MTNEVSKSLVCVVMRNGVHLWAEKDRVQKLMALLASQSAPQFIEYDGRFINKADLVGVFTAGDMEELTRRKNGEWLCAWGVWHGKGGNCACRDMFFEEPQRDPRCTKCENGYYVENEMSFKCSCWLK